MSNCAECPFKTRTIGSKGPLDSPFVIVGESPGGRELAAGIPFVGPSNEMLQTVLAEAGLPKDVVPYVTTAISCYPHKHKKGQAAKDKAAMQHATGACRGRVQNEIGAHPRKVVLTLGAAAAWAVTGDFGIAITKDRGKVIPNPLAEMGVVLAVHPAYLMRNGAGYQDWKQDIGKAVTLLQQALQPAYVEPTWEVVNNRHEFQMLLYRYSLEPMVTGDVETDSLDPHTGLMLCLGVTAGLGHHVYIIPEEVLYSNWDLTREFMERPNSKWNWHNGKFDIRWFRNYSVKARVDEDTMLLSYAHNENGGFHDLDQVAAKWLMAPNHKKVLDQYLPNRATSYRVIPSPVLYKYCAFDLAKTHQQWFPLHAKLMADRYLPRSYYDLTVPASMLCATMEQNGITVDLDKVAENERIQKAELARLDAEIQVYAMEYLGHKVNIGSWQQLQKLLWDHMQLGPAGSSTDEKHIVLAQRKNPHPVLDLLLQWRGVEKLRSTYISNLPKLVHPDGRVRASFKIHNTSTGRLAGNAPNLLNQPRGPLIRSQFIAAPGKVIVEVDLNQAELRSLATYSGDPLLCKIYRENEVSIHDITTGQFFGTKQRMSEDSSVLEHARAQLLLPADYGPSQVYAEAKMRGKAVNFGIVYGREAASLAEEFNIPVAEAIRWIEAWFALYPGAKRFIDWCRESPMAGRTLITKFGRKKRWGVVTPDNLIGLQNEAANFPHQSTASDIMLRTAIETYEQLDIRWGAKVWNELYDAIYFEMDNDDRAINEAITYVQGVCTRVPRDYGMNVVPFLGDAKVGLSWGAMKDWKGSMEATFSKQ